jgi:hypothetical protein
VACAICGGLGLADEQPDPKPISAIAASSLARVRIRQYVIEAQPAFMSRHARVPFASAEVRALRPKRRIVPAGVQAMCNRLKRVRGCNAGSA